MATRSAVVTYSPNGDGKVTRVAWSGLLQSSTDVGEGVDVPGADRSAQLTGTLGTGGAVTMQGSQDGTNWGTLHDGAGNAAVLDAVGELVQIAEAPLYIRPAVTAGNGSTNLVVTLTSRRAE